LAGYSLPWWCSKLAVVSAASTLNLKGAGFSRFFYVCILKGFA